MRTLEELAIQLDETLMQLDRLIYDIVSQAQVWNTSPYQMRAVDGRPELAAIIIARAQALAAYTAIQVDIRVQARQEQQRKNAEEYARQAGFAL